MAAPREQTLLTADARRRAAFRKKLTAWYHEVRRDLPWRRTHDPYAIWVSETMLQQTTVAMAVPHFHRFLEKFPTVAHLAAADEQSVLRMWEGLGYYSRARNMRLAAQAIMERHDGVFPSELDELRALPGIGRYTAGAIRSFAFDLPAPIVEANTRRLWARLVGLTTDATSTAGEAVLWRAAEVVLPKKEVRDVNQALMEAGCLVCTPRDPKCLLCPVAEFCEARRLGLQNAIPVMKPKPEYIALREAAVVVHRGDEVLVVQNALGGRWAGLWDFPRFTWDDEIADSGDPARIAAWLAARVAERTGVAIEPPTRLAAAKYGYTRYRVSLDVYRADAAAADPTPPSKRVRGTKNPGPTSELPAAVVASETPVRWVAADELESVPLCVSARKMSRLAAQ